MDTIIVDPLLNRKVEPLDDERAELFGLMDRFNDSVCKIRDELHYLDEKRVEDLKAIDTAYSSDIARLKSEAQTKLDEIERSRRTYSDGGKDSAEQHSG